MKIIAPTTITDAVLVSCSVPENDHAEWSNATAYTVGQKVMIAATHQTYEALTAHTNKPPATSPTDWLPLGFTNRWRMFDDKVGTVTEATGSVSVTLASGIVTAVALFGLNARDVRVVMTDPTDGVVFDRTIDLQDYTNISDWYAYFFEDIRRKPSMVLEGLPSYRMAQVTITASGGEAETVSVGALVVGRLRTYADSILAGASAGIQDFSRKERDTWGNFQVVERTFADLGRWRFVVSNNRVDAFREQLAALRATPAVYIGSGKFTSTVIYGFYRDFSVVIEYPHHSECSIEIEGLV